MRATTAPTTRPGYLRQLAAILAQPDRTAALRRLTLPTLVMHGLDDPLVSPTGGLAIARAIPRSKFIGFSGMGHDLPRPLWPAITNEILELTSSAPARRAARRIGGTRLIGTRRASACVRRRGR